ncbi:MAG: response regulator transcription factor [Halieaceae bacterium]|jgi:DNA-binding NarL/FixJ family response regulator|uniref:LuxR C-terminal-related transcriptional regulator n=1 Tax=Haliea alexandrii TaxID=2448162 RepID=UPI000F0B736C|nr:response regulator transcription factor [Haliea alexandrii]MCR9186079.1 response regulator transcription factor [Halieaceae bacterium]
MKHVFVTPGGALRNRWREAFPEALVVTSVEALALEAPAAEVAWLDASQMDDPVRRASLATAIAAGYRVVVMSAMPGEADAFQALNAGAVGYCHLESAPEQLREIGLVVAHGGLWMPPELVQRLLALSVRTQPTSEAARADLKLLTPREHDVARHIAQGASNREIAVALDITERTVKAHLSAVFEKLAVRDRVQLALVMRQIAG